MITINTRLDSGIYRSQGGGETVTHHTLTTGPRNLLRAIRLLADHRASMTRSYGNIGRGATWLEIDGVEIHDYDLDEVARDDREFADPYSSHREPTRTEKAASLIEDARSGEYRNRQKAADAEYETWLSTQ